MSSVLAWFGGDPNSLINYLFGLVIIVLYAKDKFNTPTYDKESMGPFSQLPPQLLTIDARYRQGLRIYIFLLAALYTALCIIGPNTFNNQNIQLGISANTNQLWPVASATFLISTGAAKDSSILGKIEHFIRQYAQKAAYIPSIVSNLAYAIRNVETTPWLKENADKLKQDEFDERKHALTALIGEKFVARINSNPRQQGHLAAWARANIVFYCLHQMFRDVLPSERLSQITDLPENIAIFERLKKGREELEARFVLAEEQRERNADSGVDLDKLLSDVQRYSKEVSLTIVVLLSQAARTFSNLKERLEQLGFREIELRDRSDHLVYLLMVNFSVVLGALMSYGLLLAVDSLPAATGPVSGIFARIFGWLRNVVILPTADISGDFNVVDHTGQLLIIATGALIYMVVFKVIDYLREGDLESADWRESLQGYVMVVVNASLCSTVIYILLLVLLLSPLGLLPWIWTDLAGLAQQFLFQLVVAGLAAGFAVSYLRHAVRMRWRNGEHQNWLRVILDGFLLFRERPDFIKLVHAVLAACLIGALAKAVNVHTKTNLIDTAKSQLDLVQQGFEQNQGWLSASLSTDTAQKTSARYRMPPQELIDVSCELRDIYAGVYMLDLEEGYLPLNPDFMKAVSDVPPDKAQGFGRVADCKGVRVKDSTIEREIGQLRGICQSLNAVPLVKATQQGPYSSAPQGPSGSGPPGAIQAPPRQLMIYSTLFKAPEKCELSLVSTNDDDERNFLSLGNSLAQLYRTVNSLGQFSSGKGNYAVVTFPMITAFLIAYMFGGGCRVWRAWWLNNDAGQQEIGKLREQITGIYGQVDQEDFERWLVSPLAVLNGVAPKEAVRYEGLKARLYAKIESKQIDLNETASLIDSQFLAVHSSVRKSSGAQEHPGAIP
jgi:hypothetical protein